MLVGKCVHNAVQTGVGVCKHNEQDVPELRGSILEIHHDQHSMRHPADSEHHEDREQRPSQLHGVSLTATWSALFLGGSRLSGCLRGGYGI